MNQNLFRRLALPVLAFGFILSFLLAQQSAYALPIDPCAKRAGFEISGPLSMPAPCPTPEDEAGPPAENLYDGRINNDQGFDVAAPVAIYEGSVDIFGIDPTTGSGWLTLEISDEQIAALGVPAETPALLGQSVNPFTGKDIFLYRLPGGAFQINTEYADGKPYIFMWDEAGNKHHFAW